MTFVCVGCGASLEDRAAIRAHQANARRLERDPIRGHGWFDVVIPARALCMFFTTPHPHEARP